MLTNPNPNCDGECRFQSHGSTSTLVAYIPIYDKNGVNVNPDRNTTSESVTCSTCKRSWTVRGNNFDGFTIIEEN